ncbi:unnamed protein product [Amoebophrya sp. A25]|nr:unnamed protein product [Amoebophrya sp. A25]|eukprot:GSA25T00023863001.1
MAEGYRLYKLRVVFVSKLRGQLQSCVSQLEKTLPHVPGIHAMNHTPRSPYAGAAFGGCASSSVSGYASAGPVFSSGLSTSSSSTRTSPRSDALRIRTSEALTSDPPSSSQTVSSSEAGASTPPHLHVNPFSPSERTATSSALFHVRPKRLQRRAWRITYLRSSNRYKTAIRNYVFHDYRYQFTFFNVPPAQTRQTLSACLGSMPSDVNCQVEFNYAYNGSGKDGDGDESYEADHKYDYFRLIDKNDRSSSCSNPVRLGSRRNLAASLTPQSSFA